MMMAQITHEYCRGGSSFGRGADLHHDDILETLALQRLWTAAALRPGHEQE